MNPKITLTILLSFVCLGLGAQANLVVCQDSVKAVIKPLNAVNNGPIKAGQDQKRENFEAYKALCIPYARTHDSNYCSDYGGPHTVDISCIFPDFSAPVNKPSSYDFTNTDAYLATIRDAGTQIFFRLGQSIEHTVAKYGIYPPENNRKWARICEHIIRHYNEGWADGYHWDIKYWEIWNEPDLDPLEARKTNPRTWAGTDEQFYDFYETVAKHLKKCFPDLMIGGPATCGNETWSRSFLEEMRSRNVPIDFFTWHIYHNKPAKVASAAVRFRKMLDDNGYASTESILNEWNYIRGWNSKYVYSIKQMGSLKGAAFTAAVMAVLQDSPCDMAMYYDFRPSVFCGPFDMYTYELRPPYYAFKAWASLAPGAASLKVFRPSDDAADDIWACASLSDDGRVRMLIVRYNEDDEVAGQTPVRFRLGGRDLAACHCYLTDLSHLYGEISLDSDGEGWFCLHMDPCSFAIVEF